MMARDYGHFRKLGNRVGLHYSHFERFPPAVLLIPNDLRGEKSSNRSRIREVGLKGAVESYWLRVECLADSAGLRAPSPSFPNSVSPPEAEQRSCRGHLRSQTEFVDRGFGESVEQ